MSNKQKAKTAGKIIIIVLSLAILFFLLLPFLDSPAASVGANGKKAVPQIFTSNPLSDLVQKVFALFKRDSQKATPSYHGELTEEMLASLSPEEQQKYALQRAEEGEKNFEYSTEVDANYDYGEAGIINENGEWILVRQTAPESSNLGMHEVNTRQSAYDRHIRQERAARYTGKAGADAGPAIPDSKWARLWKPIKAFFTGEDESAAVQEATGENAYLLASSGTGLGKDSYKQGSTYRRGKSANISASEWELGNRTGNNHPIFDLVSPENILQNIADNFIQTAKATLTGDQLRAYEEKVNHYLQQNKENAKQEVINKNWQILEEAAQGEEPGNLVEKTLFSGCSTASGNTNSLYRTQEEKVDENTFCDMTSEDQAKKAGEGLRTQLNAKLNEKNPQKAVPMLVLLGKTQGNPLEKADYTASEFDTIKDNSSDGEEYRELTEEEKRRKEELTKEIIDFVLEKQGCTNGRTCYWVGGEYLGQQPTLRHSVLSSGMEYYGDPLEILQKTTEEFVTNHSLNAPENVPAEQIVNEQEIISLIIDQYFKYIPYNEEDMQKLNQQNQGNGNKKFFYFVPHVADAVNMKEVLPDPTHIVYDKSQQKGNQDVLDYSSKESAIVRGNRLYEQISERMDEINHTGQNSESADAMRQFASTELLRQVNQNLQEEMQQNAGESFDIQVGLQ